ncbi:MAG: hypothetical protein MJY60_05505 [Bacteroidales bacterium]|nr:hypothetical protein [Bacteroidales bacterium]
MPADNKIQSPSELGGYTRLSMAGGRIALSAIIILVAGILAWCFFGTMTDKEYIQGVVFPSGGSNGVTIPNSGIVKEVFIHKGDMVDEGQALALVSVSGAYSIVSAPFDGEVLSYLPENDVFEAFEDIVSLLPSDSGVNVTSVTAFANFKSKRFIAPGQTVQITPANETRERIGYVRGKVTGVSAYPVSKKEAVLKLQNPSLADEIFPDDASVFEIEMEMETDPERPGALAWSFKSAESVDMSVGTFCNIEVIVKSRNIFQYMLENISDTRNSIRLWAKE